MVETRAQGAQSTPIRHLAQKGDPPVMLTAMKLSKPQTMTGPLSRVSHRIPDLINDVDDSAFFSAGTRLGQSRVPTPEQRKMRSG